MERAELSALLAQGLSLAEIGRRKGIDRSTVGKVAHRLELEPVGRLKYAPRPIDVDELRRLVAHDATVGELAGHFGVSLTTMREHFGLSGRGYTRGIAALRAEAEKCELLCSNCHAEVEECSRGLKPQRSTPNV